MITASVNMDLDIRDMDVDIKDIIEHSLLIIIWINLV